MRLIAFWIASLSGMAGLANHEFEDGFVERTFSIVVRDQTAHCEYSIGLNDKTLLDFASQCPRTESTDPADDPNSQSATQSPILGSKSLNPDDRGANESASLILDEKQTKAITKAIAKRLDISCNRESVEIKKVTIGPEPRHPFRILVQFEFELPNRTTIDLRIRDNNFPGQPGAFRGAIKARGNASLLSSNVAPILIRAKRVMLESGAPGNNEKATMIDAKIAILPPPANGT